MNSADKDSFKTATSLMEHALRCSAEEANAALDLAQALVRKGRLETLAQLVEARSDELSTLQKIRALTAYAQGSVNGSPTIARLHAILKQMPAFTPEDGIRAAIPAFEFTKKHANEISLLIQKL